MLPPKIFKVGGGGLLPFEVKGAPLKEREKGHTIGGDGVPLHPKGRYESQFNKSGSSTMFSGEEMNFLLFKRGCGAKSQEGMPTYLRKETGATLIGGEVVLHREGGNHFMQREIVSVTSSEGKRRSAN